MWIETQVPNGWPYGYPVNVEGKAVEVESFFSVNFLSVQIV